MSNYFSEPNSFRVVNCKRVSGETARKKCHKWNKMVKLRAKLRQKANFEEAEKLVTNWYQNN